MANTLASLLIKLGIDVTELSSGGASAKRTLSEIGAAAAATGAQALPAAAALNNLAKAADTVAGSGGSTITLTRLAAAVQAIQAATAGAPGPMNAFAKAARDIGSSTGSGSALNAYARAIEAIANSSDNASGDLRGFAKAAGEVAAASGPSGLQAFARAMIEVAGTTSGATAELIAFARAAAAAAAAGEAGAASPAKFSAFAKAAAETVRATKEGESASNGASDAMDRYAKSAENAAQASQDLNASGWTRQPTDFEKLSVDEIKDLAANYKGAEPVIDMVAEAERNAANASQEAAVQAQSLVDRLLALEPASSKAALQLSKLLTQLESVAKPDMSIRSAEGGIEAYLSQYGATFDQILEQMNSIPREQWTGDLNAMGKAIDFLEQRAQAGKVGIQDLRDALALYHKEVGGPEDLGGIGAGFVPPKPPPLPGGAGLDIMGDVQKFLNQSEDMQSALDGIDDSAKNTGNDLLNMLGGVGGGLPNRFEETSAKAADLIKQLNLIAGAGQMSELKVQIDAIRNSLEALRTPGGIEGSSLFSVGNLQKMIEVLQDLNRGEITTADAAHRLNLIQAETAASTELLGLSAAQATPEVLAQSDALERLQDRLGSLSGAYGEIMAAIQNATTLTPELATALEQANEQFTETFGNLKDITAAFAEEETASDQARTRLQELVTLLGALPEGPEALTAAAQAFTYLDERAMDGAVSVGNINHAVEILKYNMKELTGTLTDADISRFEMLSRFFETEQMETIDRTVEKMGGSLIDPELAEEIRKRLGAAADATEDLGASALQAAADFDELDAGLAQLGLVKSQIEAISDAMVAMHPGAALDQALSGLQLDAGMADQVRQLAAGLVAFGEAADNAGEKAEDLRVNLQAMLDQGRLTAAEFARLDAALAPWTDVSMGQGFAAPEFGANNQLQIDALNSAIEEIVQSGNASADALERVERIASSMTSENIDAAAKSLHSFMAESVQAEGALEDFKKAWATKGSWDTDAQSQAGWLMTWVGGLNDAGKITEATFLRLKAALEGIASADLSLGAGTLQSVADEIAGALGGVEQLGAGAGPMGGMDDILAQVAAVANGFIDAGDSAGVSVAEIQGWLSTLGRITGSTPKAEEGIEQIGMALFAMRDAANEAGGTLADTDHQIRAMAETIGLLQARMNQGLVPGQVDVQDVVDAINAGVAEIARFKSGMTELDRADLTDILSQVQTLQVRLGQLVDFEGSEQVNTLLNGLAMDLAEMGEAAKQDAASIPALRAALASLEAPIAQLKSWDDMGMLTPGNMDPAIDAMQAAFAAINQAMNNLESAGPVLDSLGMGAAAANQLSEAEALAAKQAEALLDRLYELTPASKQAALALSELMTKLESLAFGPIAANQRASGGVVDWLIEYGVAADDAYEAIANLGDVDWSGNMPAMTAALDAMIERVGEGKVYVQDLKDAWLAYAKAIAEAANLEAQLGMTGDEAFGSISDMVGEASAAVGKFDGLVNEAAVEARALMYVLGEITKFGDVPAELAAPLVEQLGQIARAGHAVVGVLENLHKQVVALIAESEEGAGSIMARNFDMSGQPIQSFDQLTDGIERAKQQAQQLVNILTNMDDILGEEGGVNVIPPEIVPPALLAQLREIATTGKASQSALQQLGAEVDIVNGKAFILWREAELLAQGVSKVGNAAAHTVLSVEEAAAVMDQLKASMANLPGGGAIDFSGADQLADGLERAADAAASVGEAAQVWPELTGNQMLRMTRDLAQGLSDDADKVNVLIDELEGLVGAGKLTEAQFERIGVAMLPWAEFQNLPLPEFKAENLAQVQGLTAELGKLVAQIREGVPVTDEMIAGLERLAQLQGPVRIDEIFGNLTQGMMSSLGAMDEAEGAVERIRSLLGELRELRRAAVGDNAVQNLNALADALADMEVELAGGDVGIKDRIVELNAYEDAIKSFQQTLLTTGGDLTMDKMKEGLAITSRAADMEMSLANAARATAMGLSLEQYEATQLLQGLEEMTGNTAAAEAKLNELRAAITSVAEGGAGDIRVLREAFDNLWDARSARASRPGGGVPMSEGFAEADFATIKPVIDAVATKALAAAEATKGLGAGAVQAAQDFNELKAALVPLELTKSQIMDISMALTSMHPAAALDQVLEGFQLDAAMVDQIKALSTDLVALGGYAQNSAGEARMLQAALEGVVGKSKQATAALDQLRAALAAFLAGKLPALDIGNITGMLDRIKAPSAPIGMGELGPIKAYLDSINAATAASNELGSSFTGARAAAAQALNDERQKLADLLAQLNADRAAVEQLAAATAAAGGQASNAMIKYEGAAGAARDFGRATGGAGGAGGAGGGFGGGGMGMAPPPMGGGGGAGGGGLPPGFGHGPGPGPADFAAESAANNEEAVRRARRTVEELNRVAAAADHVSNRAGFMQRTLSMAFAFSGGVAVTNVIAFISTALVGFNSRLEQAHIAFGTLLGDGAAGDKFIQQMQDFANFTPFDFAGVEDASQRFLAMGMSVDQILPSMTAIGDAVAALGGGKEKLDRVTLALGQMMTAGRVNAQDMRQLTEAGIPAWDILAKSIGKSVAETRKLAENGLIPAEQAVAVLLSGMENRFSGMMARQARTAQGAFSTIRDAAYETISGAVRPLFDAVSQGMVMLADFFTSGGGKYVAPVIYGIGVALAVALIPRLWGVAESAAAAAISIGSLEITILPLIIAASVLGTAWQENFGGMATTLQPLVSAMAQAAQAVVAFVMSSGLVVPALEAIATIITTKVVVSAIAGAISLAQMAVAEVALSATSLGTAVPLGNMAVGLGLIAAEALALVPALALAAAALVLFAANSDRVGQGVRVLQYHFLEFDRSLYQLAGNTAMVTKTQEMMDKLVAEMAAAEGEINAKAKALADAAAKNPLADLGAQIRANTPKILTATDDLVTQFGTSMSGVVEAARNAGGKAMGEMAKAILDHQQSPLEAIKTLHQMLANEMSPMALVAQGVGILASEDLANGLASGDPAVHAAALALQKTTTEQLDVITNGAYSAGANTTNNVAQGLIDSKALQKVAQALKMVGTPIAMMLDALGGGTGATDMLNKAFNMLQQGATHSAALANVWNSQWKPSANDVAAAMKGVNAELDKLNQNSAGSGALSSAFSAIQSAAEEFFAKVHQGALQAIEDANKQKNAILDVKAALIQGPVDAQQRALDFQRAKIQEWRLRQAVATAKGPAEQRDAILALNDFLAQQHIDQMQTEVDAQKKRLDGQKTANDDAANAAKAAENARYEMQRRDFERQLELLQRWLAKHPHEWQKTHSKIMQLLHSFGFSYKTAGNLLGGSFVAGLREQIQFAVDAAKELANAGGLGGLILPGPRLPPTQNTGGGGLGTGPQGPPPPPAPAIGPPNPDAVPTPYVAPPIGGGGGGPIPMAEGSWQILKDNLLATLHMDEMVAPREIAGLMRQLGMSRLGSQAGINADIGTPGRMDASRNLESRSSGESGWIGSGGLTIKVGNEALAEITDRQLKQQGNIYSRRGTVKLSSGR